MMVGVALSDPVLVRLAVPLPVTELVRVVEGVLVPVPVSLVVRLQVLEGVPDGVVVELWLLLTVVLGLALMVPVTLPPGRTVVHHSVCTSILIPLPRQAQTKHCTRICI